ncbi:MAG: cell division protein FtsX [bacterium JZ-2024 1]
MIHLLRIGVRDFLRNYQRTPLLSVAFVFQFAISLWILGSFLLFALWLKSVAAIALAEFDIRAFLTPDVTTEDARGIQDQIQAIKGVVEVQFVSADEALEQLGRAYGMDVREVFGGNPLPAGFRIRLDPSIDPEKVSDAIREIPGIEETDFTRRSEYLTRLSFVILGARILVFAALLTIGFIVAFSIAITTRLTAHAREREIQALRLVGAGANFIRFPFIVEGFVGGLASASLALSTSFIAFGTIWKYRNLYLPFLPLPPLESTLSTLATVILCVAITFGIFGPYFAVNRYLAEVAE